MTIHKNIRVTDSEQFKYMEIGCHLGMIAYERIWIGNNFNEKVKTFKYLGSLVTNPNYIQEEIKCRLKAGNSCYYSLQTLLSSRPLRILKLNYLK